MHCVIDGIECAEKLVESYEKAIASLDIFAERGVHKLPYVPHKYHIIKFWDHLWLVYQVDKDEEKVYVDFLIDNSSDYGTLFERREVHIYE